MKEPFPPRVVPEVLFTLAWVISIPVLHLILVRANVPYNLDIWIPLITGLITGVLPYVLWRRFEEETYNILTRKSKEEKL